MKKSTYTNILVVKNRAMGDAIIGLSTIQYLKSIHPHAKITYLVPSWIAPLFKNVETSTDEIIGANFKTMGDWWQNYHLISSIKPDCIFEMFQSGRTNKFFSLYSKLKGIPYFYHNHHTDKGNVHDQGTIKANIQRDLDGAWSFFSTQDIPNHLQFTPTMNCDGDQTDHIIFGVVATRKTKMWPLEFYAKLSHQLNGKVLIPLSKSKDDQEIKEKLIAHNIQGDFLEVGLDELPKKLTGAKVYIGNDTGIKHLCIALGIPTYTLFGPEPPMEWHPYNESDHPYYFKEPLECRTRDAHYCGLSTCDEMICLNQFDHEDLFQDLSKRGMI